VPNDNENVYLVVWIIWHLNEMCRICCASFLSAINIDEEIYRLVWISFVILWFILSCLVWLKTLNS